jgi:hypothetical protein
VQREVHGFVGQADVAVPVDHGIGGVQHQGAAGHQTILHVERGGSAAQFHVLVARQEELDDIAPVQRSNRHEQVADLAAPHQHGHVARRGCQHLGGGIAPALQLDQAVDLAQAGPGQLDGREQLAQLQCARIELDLRDGRIAVAVDADAAGQAAAGDTEIGGIEQQHAVLEFDMHAHALQRQLPHLGDARRAVLHVRVHGFQPGQVQRSRRQHPARWCIGARDLGRNGAGRERCELRQGRGAARLLGQAHQRRQVVEVERLRLQLAGEQRHSVRPVETQLACEVGIAQLAVDLADVPDLAFLAQAAADLVARRRRQHHAEQLVQLGEVRALQREAGIGTVQRCQVADGAGGPQHGVGRHGMDLQRERPLLRAAEVQHAAGAAFSGEGLLLPEPFRLVCQRQRRIAAVVDRELGADVGAVAAREKVQHALVDHQRADVGQVVPVRGIAPQRPAAATIGLHLQRELRLGQLDQRQFDAAADQGQQADVDLGGLRLQQIGILRPVGIGELDAVGQHARGAAQLHVEMPRDLEAAAGALAHIAVQRAAQHVPRKEHGQQDQRQQRHGERRQQPGPERMPAVGSGGCGRSMHAVAGGCRAAADCFIECAMCADVRLPAARL